MQICVFGFIYILIHLYLDRLGFTFLFTTQIYVIYGLKHAKSINKSMLFCVHDYTTKYSIKSLNNTLKYISVYFLFYDL